MLPAVTDDMINKRRNLPGIGKKSVLDKQYAELNPASDMSSEYLKRLTTDERTLVQIWQFVKKFSRIP